MSLEALLEDVERWRPPYIHRKGVPESWGCKCKRTLSERFLELRFLQECVIRRRARRARWWALDQQVLQVDRSHSIQGLVGQEQHFVLDPVWHTQPVEITHEGTNVIIFPA